MAARPIKQKYTPAKVGVQPPAKGQDYKDNGKDAEGVKQEKK